MTLLFSDLLFAGQNYKTLIGERKRKTANEIGPGEFKAEAPSMQVKEKKQNSDFSLKPGSTGLWQ